MWADAIIKRLRVLFINWLCIVFIFGESWLFEWIVSVCMPLYLFNVSIISTFRNFKCQRPCRAEPSECAMCTRQCVFWNKSISIKEADIWFAWKACLLTHCLRETYNYVFVQLLLVCGTRKNTFIITWWLILSNNVFIRVICGNLFIAICYITVHTTQYTTIFFYIPFIVIKINIVSVIFFGQIMNYDFISHARSLETIPLMADWVWVTSVLHS